MLFGSQVGHQLAYRLAYPQAAVRVHVLSAAGHGYEAGLPLAIGVVGSIAVCVLIWASVDAVRGGAARPVPPLAFAVLPALGFTLQEFVERWLAVGGWPWWLVLQPSFRIGLVLQVPVGLAAFVAARLLLRAAHRLGRRVRTAAPPPPLPALLALPRSPALDSLVRALAVSAPSTRGPPLLAQ